MEKHRHSPAMRCYVQRLAICMVGYAVTLVAAVRLVGQGGLRGVPGMLLAAAPGLCLVGVFWAIGRLLVEETDEYQRMMITRQTLWGAGFALSVATVWNFVAGFGFGVPEEGVPIAMLFFAGFGIGALINRMQNR